MFALGVIIFSEMKYFLPFFFLSVPVFADVPTIATKGYVDSGILHAKQYADGKLPLSGGTMTGALHVPTPALP
jgi:hypothetical protein